jgi:GNAT superfamily N-acetyltransferase
MTITIREATAGDAEPAARLLREVFAATYGAAIPPEVLGPYLARRFDVAAVACELARPGAGALLAAAGGALAGVALLGPQPPPAGCAPPAAGELDKLYIGAAHRGHGLGAALLAESLGWARAAGWCAIWLAVWRHNPRAVAFYRRHGFAATGRMSIFVDQVEFDDLVMSRGLDDRRPDPVE